MLSEPLIYYGAKKQICAQKGLQHQFCKKHISFLHISYLHIRKVEHEENDFEWLGNTKFYSRNNYTDHCSNVDRWSSRSTHRYSTRRSGQADQYLLSTTPKMIMLSPNEFGVCYNLDRLICGGQRGDRLLKKLSVFRRFHHSSVSSYNFSCKLFACM